jgi:hypothetical protein
VETSPVFDEIRAGGVRDVLMRQGRRKFKKAPTRKQQQELLAITDLERLESLAERLLNVQSWAQLLNGD